MGISNTESVTVDYTARAGAARAAVARWADAVEAVAAAAVDVAPRLGADELRDAREQLAVAERAARSDDAAPAAVLAAAIAEAAAVEAASRGVAAAAQAAAAPALRESLIRGFSPSAVEKFDRAGRVATAAAVTASATAGAALRVAARAGAATGAPRARLSEELLDAALAGGRPAELLLGALECARAPAAFDVLRDRATGVVPQPDRLTTLAAGLAYSEARKLPRARRAGEDFIDARARAPGAAYNPSELIASGHFPITAGAVLTPTIVERLRTIYPVAGTATAPGGPDTRTPAVASAPILVSADGGATVSAVGSSERAWCPLGGPAPRALAYSALVARAAETAAARDAVRWGGLAPAYEAAADSAPAPSAPPGFARALVAKFVAAHFTEPAPNSIAPISRPHGRPTAGRTGGGRVGEAAWVSRVGIAATVAAARHPRHDGAEWTADESPTAFALAVCGEGGLPPAYVTAAVADAVGAEHAADLRAVAARAGRASRAPPAATARELGIGRALEIRRAAGDLRKRIAAAYYNPLVSVWALPAERRRVALSAALAAVIEAAIAAPPGGEPFALSAGRDFKSWALLAPPADAFAPTTGGGLSDPSDDMSVMSDPSGEMSVMSDLSGDL